jgi:glycosyltransferase involved in cell wall biosynthesis
MKKISFILPGVSEVPIGGFKIVFEYANRLSKLGYNITIYFPLITTLKNRSILRKIKIWKKYYLEKYNKKEYEIKWFDIEKKVKLKVVPTLNEKYIEEADIIFATARETSKYVNKYLDNKGKKYYLIQGYENWGCSEAELLETWKYPLKKIVISQWLGKIAEKIGEEYSLVYNGLDFEKFKIVKKIEERENNTILCLYHKEKIKGFEYGLEALKSIKKKFGDIKIKCFGVYQRPSDLPEWIEYYYQPSQKELNNLYNSSSIFLGTSLGEGWGLTIAEAMQCGCAVICTDVNGYNEMAFDYKTALLCNSCDSKSMEQKIIEMLKNDELRKNIAKEGNKFIQRFTWEESIFKIIKIINKNNN